MVRKSCSVHALSIAALILLQGSVLNSAQPPQVQTTSSPFTLEQTAVYHAFLTDYHRGNTRQEPIAVSEFTDILQPDEGDYSGCMKGFPQNPPTKMIHRLTENFANVNHLQIVDPKLHRFQDPEEGMRNGLSVESAVESGFKSGLLTISEIIFDTKHKRAAFRYSFYCGSLCGHAETLVYERYHRGWKPSKLSCGFGIS